MVPPLEPTCHRWKKKKKNQRKMASLIHSKLYQILFLFLSVFYFCFSSQWLHTCVALGVKRPVCPREVMAVYFHWGGQRVDEYSWTGATHPRPVRTHARTHAGTDVNTMDQRRWLTLNQSAYLAPRRLLNRMLMFALNKPNTEGKRCETFYASGHEEVLKYNVWY